MFSTLYYCLLSSSLLALSQSSWALRNVTLDDTDSSITWVGNWTTVPPGFSHPLGGSYRVTTDPTAYAEFKFTGVAVHFVSPRFPAVASSKLALDGDHEIAQVVNLEDYETKTTDPEFGHTAVLASAGPLDLVEHTVRVSMGGKEGYGVFDAFIYTVYEEGDGAIPAIISIGGFQTVVPSPTIASAPGTAPNPGSAPSESSPLDSSAPSDSPLSPNSPPPSSNPASPPPNVPAPNPDPLPNHSPSNPAPQSNAAPQPNAPPPNAAVQSNNPLPPAATAPGTTPLSSIPPRSSGGSESGSPLPTSSQGAPAAPEEDGSSSTSYRASILSCIMAAALALWTLA